MSWASGAEQQQNVAPSQRQEAGSFLGPFTPILTRCFLGVGMPVYSRQSGVGGVHFVEDNLHLPGNKKNLCWGRKGHWEQIEWRWGVPRSQEFPADGYGWGDNQAAHH